MLSQETIQVPYPAEIPPIRIPESMLIIAAASSCNIPEGLRG